MLKNVPSGKAISVSFGPKFKYSGNCFPLFSQPLVRVSPPQSSRVRFFPPPPPHPRPPTAPPFGDNKQTAGDPGARNPAPAAAAPAAAAAAHGAGGALASRSERSDHGTGADGDHRDPGQEEKEGEEGDLAAFFNSRASAFISRSRAREEAVSRHTARAARSFGLVRLFRPAAVAEDSV